MDIQELLLKTDELKHNSNVERKKRLLRVNIIQNLYFQGPMTNMEICEQFNISSPTSIRLLNQLITEGWVKKNGRGKSAGGRKPDLYRLESDSFFIMGIQLERSRIKIAIFDNQNNKVSEFQDLFEIENDNGLVDHIHDEAIKLLQKSKIALEKLIGIGVSMPGLVSSKEGKNFTYFINKEEPASLQGILKQKFRKPVFILNDAKSACLAESNFGLAKNKQDVLVVSMDWGVGLGIIIDGQVYEGSSGFAGEFGHIPLIDDGLLCHCGKRGCLETVASGVALTRMVQEGIRAGESTSLVQLSEKQLVDLQPKDIIEAANMGDQFSIKILGKIGINLGKGLAILIQLFNPELIIIEGNFAKAQQFLTIPIQQSINTFCMAQLREKTNISLSELGDDSVLLGSVAAVMKSIFENQIVNNQI